MIEPVAIGRLQLLQEPPFTLCGTRQQRSRASLRDLIFECRAFGVIFLEPCFRSVCICKDLQMVGIADLLARVDIDDVCHCWSLLSLRRPQCVSLREESNSRTTFRFNALMTPMRANIVGPSCSATSNSACIAACHSSASCSALGSSVMYSAASRRVTSGSRSGVHQRLKDYSKETRFDTLANIFKYITPIDPKDLEELSNDASVIASRLLALSETFYEPLD